VTHHPNFLRLESEFPDEDQTVSSSLGFERKARLFCDKSCAPSKMSTSFGWDLSVRLGYFVTSSVRFCCVKFSIWILLGFERKARLFCDHLIAVSFIH